MARSVYQIQSIVLPPVFVVHLDGMALYSDALLLLQIHRVEHLGLHVPAAESMRQLYHPVRQGALSVVDMRYYAKIPGIFHFSILISRQRYAEKKTKHPICQKHCAESNSRRRHSLPQETPVCIRCPVFPVSGHHSDLVLPGPEHHILPHGRAQGVRLHFTAAHPVHKQLRLREIGECHECLHLAGPFRTASPGEVKHRDVVSPVGLVEIESVLAHLAVEGDKPLVVYPRTVTLMPVRRAAIRKDVKKAPSSSRYGTASASSPDATSSQART